MFTNEYALQDSKALLVESNWSGCPLSLRLLLAALLIDKSIFFQPHKNHGVFYISVDSSKMSIAIASSSVVEVYSCPLLATFAKSIG